MKILLAKSAGFCFGVGQAMKKAYELAEKENIYTFGPLIHNKRAIEELEKNGIYSLHHLQDIQQDQTILIRTHGISPYVYQEIEKKSFHVIDATCPFVKKIHRIVESSGNKAHAVLIFGDASHPEIQAIQDYADEKIIVSDLAEAKNIKLDPTKHYDLVFQTTFSVEESRKIIAYFKNSKHVTIHNTICLATEERQTEAKILAQQCDHMIVIGDKMSANSKKLYEICKEYCKNTKLIETIDDLELNNFEADDIIGITAGASTPSVTIKEVFDTMIEQEQNGQNLEDKNEFLELLDETFVSLHSGQVVKGTVISVADDGSVAVNLGYKMDGIIEKDEFSSDPFIKANDVLKPDDVIEVYVMHVNDREGLVNLSTKRLEFKKGLEEIEKAFEEKTPLKVVVNEVVKGGLLANYKGSRVFIPASQIALHYVENLDHFKLKEIEVEILDYDKRKKRIVAGAKELLKKQAQEIKEKVFSELKIGDVKKGIVRRITDFGAFVDIGNIDGLIHISELSWGRVKHTKDVLNEGDSVEVLIIDMDPDKEKISLSLKATSEDPWKHIEEKYKTGDIIEGKVVRIVPFGAFLELEEGVDGLIHISHISEKHIVKPEDHVHVGDILKVKVLEANADKKQISLSRKEAQAEEIAEEFKDIIIEEKEE